MTTLANHIQTLYEAKLYEDVKTLSSFAMTLSDHNPEMFTPTTKYHLLCLQADAYFYCLQYKQAEAAYRNALQVRKLVMKGKGKSQGLVDTDAELDMKFNLHQCYVHLKQFTEAIHTLESISPKQRTCKINLALAQLYQRTGGNDRSAVTAYKEVLRECQLSFSAVQGLLSLGMKWQEVEQLVLSDMPPHVVAAINWVSTMIKAQGLISTREFGSAVTVLKSLDTKPLLRDNTDLLTTLGEAHFYNGDSTSACTTLQRVHVLNPLCLPKMDLLAYLIYKDDQAALSELEKLAVSLVDVSESAAEPWVAMGYFSLKSKRFPRAVYFAQKALSLDSRNVEALSLKGLALVEVKKTPEAVSHFREALRLAPYRFEAYNNLISCYMLSHRTREALACASEMCKKIHTCRSLTTYARLLSKEPLNCEKAKGYLERAMKLDPNNFDAVYVMATILGQQQQYEAAVKLLETLVGRHSSFKLYSLLGQYLTRLDNKQAAAEHYYRAMRAEQFNDSLAAGVLARLEKACDPTAEGTFDCDVEAMDSSDNEDYLPHTPQDRRVPPVVRLDSSASDAGDSDPNADMIFTS